MKYTAICTMVLTVALLAMVPLATAEKAPADKANAPEVNQLLLSGSVDIAKLSGVPAAHSRASCDGNWQSSPSGGIIPWQIDGPVYLACYQDPDETGCTDTYPFRVEKLHMGFHNPSLDMVVVDLQPVIYAVDLSVPSCPRPGVVLYRGAPVQTLLIPLSSIPLELDIGDYCAAGPYFIGVELPSSYLSSSAVPMVDDGVSPPPRSCASYCNYRGFWEDLVVDFGWSVNLWLYSTGETQTGCDTCAVKIEAGVDLWETSRDGSLLPPDVFDAGGGGYPIPADFFGPGSDPFDNPVAWVAPPLTTLPPNALGQTDAIIRRNAAAVLPTEGVPDPIPIEIVALSLVSANPVVVTYNGGQNPEEWDVQACLSDISQAVGGMNVTRDCCLGGSFTSNLPILPKFYFVRVSDMTVRVWDFGFEGNYINHVTPDGKWSAEIHPPYVFTTSPGLVLVDDGCSLARSPGLIGPNSRFLRCENATGDIADCHFRDPCDPSCCIGIRGSCQLVGLCDDNEQDCDISDLTNMIDHLFISYTPLCCIDESDVAPLMYGGVADGAVDIADLTGIIDHLFISYTPMPPC